MEAIGLTLDGDELRLARLRRQRGGVEIMSLERVWLGGVEAGGETQTEDHHYRDVMGLADPDGDGDGKSPKRAGAASAVVAEEAPADTVSREERLLHNALFRHAEKGTFLGLALAQEEVTFTTVAIGEDLPARKLRSRVREELARVEPTVGAETFDFVTRNGGSVLAFSHSGEMALLERVRRVNEALAEPLRLDLVDVSEVALMGLCKRLTPVASGMTVLIYVGHQFSRLLFFRDGGLHDMSPVIHEGVSAVGNLSQCYGRIVAELDVAGEESLAGIYVAGGADCDEYRAFFEEHFPGCGVQGLPFEEGLTGDAGLLADAGAFAISVSLAWKILEGPGPGLAETNFLPADLRRRWWSTALAWHGWALLGGCAAALVLSVTAAAVLHTRTAEARAELQQVEQDIAAVTPAAQAVDELGRRIAAVGEQSALVDSLLPTRVPASDLIRDLAEASRQVNSMWITDLSLSDDDFAVQGVSLYGNRIHRFAETQPGTRIHNVALTTILGKTLYQYDISGSVPSAAEVDDREVSP